MKPIIAISFFLLPFLSISAQKNVLEKLAGSVTERSLKTNLKKIAGEQFEGRMAGSSGDSLAIEFIANWFAEHHINNPYPSSDPYLQDITLTHKDYSQSKLFIDGREFLLDSQWACFQASKAFTVNSAEVVFIGYGLSISGFDEFKDLDVEGKMILLSFDFPNSWKGKKIIDQKDLPGDQALLKGILNKKPLGFLVYDNDLAADIIEDIQIRKFVPYYNLPEGQISALGGCFISAELGNTLIGRNIDSVYNTILKDGRPHSFYTNTRISLSIIKKDEHKRTSNIVGIIKGTNENLPCVVITAHHDDEGKIDGSTYYGADDNGSGTTALLEIAKIVGNASSKGTRLKRSIVFVSTAAEEQGLIGGDYYVQHPVIPLSNTYCNINMDMLGRVDSFYNNKRADINYVYYMYRDSTKNIFNRMKLERISQKYGALNLDTLYEKYSKNVNYGLITRSDNLPFMKMGIPAIWFFSGFHKDYHQPTDTPDKINYSLLRRRTQLVLATLWQLANE